MLFNPKRRRKELKQLHKINPSVLKGFNNKISKIDLHRIARTFILKITTGETRIDPPGDPTTIPVTTLTKIRWPASFVKSKDIVKKSAGKEPMPINPVWGFLAKNQYYWQWCSNPGPAGPGFSILSLMEPLCQAPAIIPQIIMSLCAVSIVTYNTLSEILMPFHGGNKIRPRTTGTTTFNWLFDTGAAITCMNADSFREALDILDLNYKRKCRVHRS
jgi:hypothetical protein